MRNVSHKQSCISGNGPQTNFLKSGVGESARAVVPAAPGEFLKPLPLAPELASPVSILLPPCVACSWCVSKPACSPVLGGVTARSAWLPRQGARQPATATCPAVSTGMPTSTPRSWQLPRHSQAGYVPWVILASCWQGKEESRKAQAQRPQTLGGGPQPSNVISKLFLQGIRQNASAPRMSLVTSP